jgi:ketosteroid isomerase-like protein
MSRRTDIAKAFATHDFDAAAPHLANDVRWNAVGAASVTGRDAVSQTYRQTLSELASTTTRFRELRVIDAGECVVVQSIGEYTEPDGTVSVVASCDIMDFADGLVTVISSYMVELPESDQQ